MTTLLNVSRAVFCLVVMLLNVAAAGEFLAIVGVSLQTVIPVVMVLGAELVGVAVVRSTLSRAERWVLYKRIGL